MLIEARTSSMPSSIHFWPVAWSGSCPQYLPWVKEGLWSNTMRAHCAMCGILTYCEHCVFVAEQCWANSVRCFAHVQMSLRKTKCLCQLETDQAGVLPHLLVIDQLTQCHEPDVKCFHCFSCFGRLYVSFICSSSLYVCAEILKHPGGPDRGNGSVWLLSL